MRLHRAQGLGGWTLFLINEGHREGIPGSSGMLCGAGATSKGVGRGRNLQGASARLWGCQQRG